VTTTTPKRATLATMALLAAGLSGSAPASVHAQAETLFGSAHDFSGHQSADASGQVNVNFNAMCGVCHTPLGQLTQPDVAGAPEYQMYKSASMDMRTASMPNAASLACLACHDGTIGTDVATEPGAVVGTDLRNDHPISIVYDNLADPAFRPIADVETAGLKLFFGDGEPRVECATCHNPHDNTTARPFLRTETVATDSCQICHIK